MSRISELEFYNDKDVITQIEWLKNNIKADHIDHIQVVQNADKSTDDYGLTTVKITMENGHEYKGEVISAILKDVRIQSGEDFNVMVFELANGETINCNIPLGSDSYWAKIKGEPQSNTALKAWMDEKAEAVDLTNETQIRVRSDEALGQRITDHERVVNEQIERIDGILIDKADRSALDEEINHRTEADTGLLQAITEEETARKSADETLETAITGKADQSALETEIAARTDSDTGLLQAITAEETARKSADDGIYGRITALNKDLDDETTAREEEDNILNEKIDMMGIEVNNKEDVANKVTSWSATPNNTRYPSEKLVKDSMRNLYLTDDYSLIQILSVNDHMEAVLYGGRNNVIRRVQIIHFDKYLNNLQSNTVKLFGTSVKPQNQNLIAIQVSFNGVRYKLEWLDPEPGYGAYRLMATRLDGQNWGTDRVAGYGLLLTDGTNTSESEGEI